MLLYNYFSLLGQNKNKYVIGHMMWRVMTGRHEKIEYCMQIPGHARCLVDSGFACLKKLYRRSDCDTIGQLQDVVNKSSSTNTTVRYPTWQWMDWKAFLEPVFKSVKGIRSVCASVNLTVHVYSLHNLYIHFCKIALTTLKHNNKKV